MSMFHVVFVMNPPTLEYHIRVQEMYDNVVKKFSKALKYEQTHSGWVEREAKKILTMKTQAKESSEIDFYQVFVALYILTKLLQRIHHRCQSSGPGSYSSLH